MTEFAVKTVQDRDAELTIVSTSANHVCVRILDGFLTVYGIDYPHANVTVEREAKDAPWKVTQANVWKSDYTAATDAARGWFSRWALGYAMTLQADEPDFLALADRLNAARGAELLKGRLETKRAELVALQEEIARLELEASA